MNLHHLRASLAARSFIFATALLAAGAATSHATSIAITNPGFEQTLVPGSSEFGTRYPAQQVTGWTTSGYNFVFTPGTADTTGAPEEFGCCLSLYGPGNGTANGLTSTSPAGGNFIAADGAFGQAPISQVVSGLTIGAHTQVTFYFAGAQQNGFNGATTEQWLVSLGSETHGTVVLNNVDHGFTGWRKVTLDFHPTSTSETLSFLAVGTPDGVPPFSLLDGVGVTQTPEPSSFALLFTGVAGVGGIIRKRFKK